MAAGRPELVVDVDREKAALYGLNTNQIGRTVRAAINGVEASKFRDGKEEYDITVRLAPEYREDLSALERLTLVPDDGGQVPLSSVARLQVGRGVSDVRRKDLDRVATVSSDVRSGYNANAVLAEVQTTLEDFVAGLPAGYQLRYAGSQEEQAEAQAFLSAAFLIALMLIGFILVWQFDSVTKPLIIMTSVILSTIGVLLGLIVFQMPFGIIMTGVGVISLAGVVVNNAIVLIDYTDLLRLRDGLTRREAVVRAGRTRFRPVVLTAITTVLGLIPLSVGLNIDFLGLYSALQPDFYWGGEQAAWWGQMGIAVIVGLSFATVLTLVVVPCTYSLLDDLDKVLAKHFVSKRPRTGEYHTVGKPDKRGELVGA
jgi:multidrug efflux pump subunit AcrB